jgi:L-fuconolactonase
MFGSDWPVLRLNGDYATWLAMAEMLTAEFAPESAQAVFGRNASNFYRLARPGWSIR